MRINDEPGEFSGAGNLFKIIHVKLHLDITLVDIPCWATEMRGTETEEEDLQQININCQRKLKEERASTDSKGISELIIVHT